MFVWFLLQFLLCEIWRGFFFLKGFVCLFGFCFSFYYAKFGEAVGGTTKGREGKKERKRETSFFQVQDMPLADPCRCCNEKVTAPEANPHMLRMSTRPLFAASLCTYLLNPYPNFYSCNLQFFFHFFIYLLSLLYIRIYNKDFVR